MNTSTLRYTSYTNNEFSDSILDGGILQSFINKFHECLSNGNFPDVLVLDLRENSDKSITNDVAPNSLKYSHDNEVKPHLTNREKDVLRLIAKGLSYNEVAETLIMSAHTVRSHIKNIYRKLSVHSRGEATFEALQLGILEPQ